MFPRKPVLAVLLLCLLFVACVEAHVPPLTTRVVTPVPVIRVSLWLTTPDLGAALALQPPLQFQPAPPADVPVVAVDTGTRYQQMVGIGASLTGTAGYLIGRSSQRDLLMRSLFSPTAGIGLSFLRQPLGSSDFSDVPFYSYEDRPGEFSLGHARTYTIPLLQQAERLNPLLSLMGSVWSPPGWMKDSWSLLDGTLLPSHYQDYASYLVQTLQAYQAEGLPLGYLSPQNEPGYVGYGYPGAHWNGAAEARFIREDLQPALAQAGPSPTLLGYDSFGADEAGFLAALDGLGVDSALHCYGGVPSSWLGDLFETECATSMDSAYASTPAHPLQAAQMLLDWSLAGSRTLVLWNIAADQNLGPQPRGNQICGCKPLLTIQTDASGQPTGQIVYRPDFYMLGQFSKFVQPGAYRVADIVTGAPALESVAFENADGTVAVVVYNRGATEQPFALIWQGQAIQATLPAGAVATLVWQSTDTNKEAH